MTTLMDKPVPALDHVPLKHARLPRWAPLLVLVIAAAGSGLVGLLLDWGLVAIVVVALLLYLVVLPSWSRVVENRRSAVDRFVTALVWVTLGLAFVPLASLLWTVIREGAPVLDVRFFT